MLKWNPRRQEQLHRKVFSFALTTQIVLKIQKMKQNYNSAIWKEKEQDATKVYFRVTETDFFIIDEQTAHDNALTKIALSHAVQSHHLQHDKSKRGKNMTHNKCLSSHENRQTTVIKENNIAHPNTQKTKSLNSSIICYKCDKPGDIAPNSPNPKNHFKKITSKCRPRIFFK